MEKNKVELVDGIITWDKLDEIILQYKNYNGNKYTDLKIGVYNIDMNTKQDVIEFIHVPETNTDDITHNTYSEEEMFKYWKFVKLNKDIRFKDSIDMFGNLNSIYMFFTEDTIALSV